MVGRSSGRGTTASTWPKRRFDSASPKSSGSFSRVVCATTRGPAKDISAPGSARITSPRLAKLAVTPPVVGWASTEMSVPPASCSSSTAATVFGSCISARIPSCMRAPPDAETETTARRAVGGAVAGAGELLADDAAHRAAHEGEVHRRKPARAAVDRGPLR